MTRRLPLRAVLMLAAALCASGCSRIGAVVKGITTPGPAAFDKTRLDAAIDRSIGGPDTCVVLDDAASGAEAYRYGSNGACMRRLPPCATFDAPMALIALDAGLATSTTTFNWDRSPQPTKAWERDVDFTAAFRQSIPWVFQQLARKVGAATFADRLGAFGYGDHAVTGPVDGFWQGPQASGALAISTREQARFMQRLYAGRLPVKPQTAAFVTANMADETRGASAIGGVIGTCASNADGSRQVGWWVGRVKGPNSDYVFAASVEGEGSLPGLEVQTRLKGDLAQAGLWSPAS